MLSCLYCSAKKSVSTKGREMHTPARQKVSKGICHITAHREDDGPFTAQIFDHYRRQKH